MKILNTTTRICISLTCITVALVLAMQGLNWIPDPSKIQVESRTKLCESIAIYFTSALNNNQIDTIRTATPWLVQRHPDILSLAVCHSKGQTLVESDKHLSLWNDTSDKKNDIARLQIPLIRRGQNWGEIQICFRSVVAPGFLGYLKSPGMRIVIFLAILSFPLYWLYLRKILRHLDPARVIPERVKTVLDTLSEGVLILDNKGQIVLANDAFAKSTGRSNSKLMGRKASEINWTKLQSEDEQTNYPWEESMQKGDNQKGIPLALKSSSKQKRTFMVNSSPIRGADKKLHGVLATFDDVSEIEEKNIKLEKTLKLLRDSRDKIKQQNDNLKILSMHDPLTDCLNRRAFFERFEAEWSSALRDSCSICCVMIDIDHFKNINDQHGHLAGDKLLKKLGEVVKANVRSRDSVCRYGGEEFCILLTNIDIDQAVKVTEKIWQHVKKISYSNISITASFGVSAYESGLSSPQELIGRADKALYAAKNKGRNCVVSWDQLPEEMKTLESEDGIQALEESEDNIHISFSAVSALMSALEHRNAATAAHSRRVADLCVAMANKIMSTGDCFILEIAALLHDIGKIGMPDSILLKPGPLTDEEWKIMDSHDQMGVNIIVASFAMPELTQIVKNSHAWYGGSPRDRSLPKGQEIPLRSRIILIADSFDAMTSERPYRKALSQEEAFAELRRCSGTQFDPELVEHTIETILARDENRSVAPLSTEQDVALRIGVEMEKLACAAESHGVGLLAATAEQLIAHASVLGFSEIAKEASKLKETAMSEPDFDVLVEQTTELLELCRTHQDSYLSAKPSRKVDS